ncbi:hypothetical protein ATKI12_9109, partial [Kitasatospora sp. Ki12]
MSNITRIKRFLIDEFLPDVTPEQLADDHDLLSDGVIDSLGVLKLIAWSRTTSPCRRRHRPGPQQLPLRRRHRRLHHRTPRPGRRHGRRLTPCTR